MAKFALLIGVSEYQADLKAIPAAVRDVEALKQVLINPDMGEFPESNVTVLTNPNKGAMEIAIYKLFASRQRDDLVLFYFSGHGVKDERFKLYLSTSETILDKGRLMPPTAVEARYLHDRMNESKSKRQVIILDCCFSGAFPEGFNIKSAGIDYVDIAAQLDSEGRAILTSSTSTQYSYEQAGSDLSIYTRYLVEGITNGAADQDGDGRISVDELHNYASRKVREVSPAMTPQFYPTKEGYKIWLAKAPVNDPKLIYRKEVELRVNHGKISKVARRLLNSKQTQLSLLPEEAAAIEFEVLQPHREFQRKLEEYEQALLEAVEEGYPDNEIVSNDLQAYQHDLGLRDEDIDSIRKRILVSMTSPPTLQGEGSQTPPFPSREGGMGGLGQFQFDIVTVNAKGEETSRSRGQAEYFTADLGNGVTLDMVSIPGGEFLMGSPDEELERTKYESPQHKVTVPPFFMGKFPVTQAQWRAVASLPRVNHDLESDPSNFKGVNRPVEMVSWFHAVEFCQRLSQKLGREYRLPTEAEWEYACRAGTTTPFHFGETINTDLVNYNGNYVYGSGAKGKYRAETTDVGSFGVANAFGLYDMHGLVWEWCLDHWHESYEGAPSDGGAWLIKGKDNDNHYRLLRGGSWHSYPRYCRCAYRSRVEPVYWLNYFGFRVVCSPARTP